VERLEILVVDDEPGMRLGVERALRTFSVHLPEVNGEIEFATAQAASGEEALERISAAPPDILLLDHKLPGVSGLDVLDQLAARPIDTLTIMITAYASLETAITATKRGAFDFLAKPFTPEELKGAVRKAAKHLVLQRQARKLAEEKRQIRFEFISVLAHELKNPLAAIEGYLRIMKEGSAGNDPAVQAKMVDRSLVRIEGMRKLILDLLDLTRIESGQKRRELARVDVCEVAQSVTEGLRAEAQQRGIAVELHATKPVAMAADRGELEIVLSNLISNAIKYNRDDGRVDVYVGAEDGQVTISVADTGIGMTQEEAAHLFQEFVRIKNSRTRSILGSGLGLSIVRRIAQLYGGHASVRSEPDVGSTFTVTLQRDQQTQPLTDDAAAARAAPHAARVEA